MRRLWRIVAACALVAALSGCAGLPTSGPVQPGPVITEQAIAPDVTFRPNAPQPGATPEQVVDGFVTAASGPQNDWQTARLYLAPDYRETWKPQAGVTVDVLADRLYVATGDDAITLQVTPRGTVDARGTYADADGATTALSYTLAQQADGEWRITSAPDGILLDEDQFQSVFHSYSVVYFDPTWEFLVPDMRWFPTYNAATRVADALVNGEPADWLADSVVTAFPENVELVPSVPVVGGAAQAQLSDQALTVDQTTLDRMQTQLSASLATAQVSQVDMLVEGTAVDARRLPTRDTMVDARALVLTAEGFGYLVSGELTPIPGLSDAIEAVAPVAIQLGRERTTAAVRLPDGSAALVYEDGRITPLDGRPGLLDPTIDPFDTVWTVPGGDPTAVIATTEDGTVIPIAGAWTGASRIHSMQVSRDGTRMAAIVSFGGRRVLAVAGVVRDEDGVPRALGSEPLVLGGISGDGTDIGWLDTTTVGAVVADGTDVRFVEQPVGGIVSVVDAPPGAVELAGVNIASAVRLRTADGALFVRRSSNWVQTATGVTVLAVQQGNAR